MAQRTETVTTLVPAPWLVGWDDPGVQDRVAEAFGQLLDDANLSALAEPEWSKDWLTPERFVEIIGDWPSDVDMPAGAWRFTADVLVDGPPIPAE